MCSEVHNVLVSHLLQVFGDDYDTVPLAVRSSASGISATPDFVFFHLVLLLILDTILHSMMSYV